MTLRCRSVRQTSKPSRPGQHAVEQDDVEGVAGRPLQPGLAVDGRHDLVAFGRQPVGERHHEAGFVFDEQDAGHQSSDECRVRSASADAGAERPCRQCYVLMPTSGLLRRVPATRRRLRRDRPAGAATNVLPCAVDALHGHAAAVRLDDALDDAEAEAVAVNLARLRVGAAVERLEDVRQIGRRDAQPLVGRPRCCTSGPLRPGRRRRRHADPPARAAVLDGVGDQVGQARSQRGSIDQHRRQPLGDVHFQRDSGVGDRVLRRRDGLADERADGMRRAMADRLAGLDAGVEQDALDRVAQAPATRSGCASRTASPAPGRRPGRRPGSRRPRR